MIRSGAAVGGSGSDSLNATRRARELDELAHPTGDQTVDVLVVGGGITGTWVALDAASRGLSVALAERGDLAQGTSRWSSKLAHGGLRYLASYDFGLAWESASERAILMDVSAPHLIRPIPMLMPLGAAISPAAGARLELGTRIGDTMRMAAGTSRHRLPSTRRISAQEARRLAPALDPDGLRGALLHWDGQLEDDARLVLAVARTAAAHGARILTYASASDLTANGATIRDEHGDGQGPGGSFRLRARHVVNAAGVWAGELTPGVSLRPSKGSHLLIAAERLGDPRALVNAPLPDSHGGRFVFAVPRPDGLVLVGLTDEPYAGPIPDVPQVEDDEERFLLDGINRILDRDLTSADVVGRFAGLRPLLDGADDATADLSRRHAVLDHDGVLTVVGGKLTTARRMAQDTVDRIAARPGVQAGACVTRRLPLTGASTTSGRTSNANPALTSRYGSEAPRVAELARTPAELEPLAPGVPVCVA